MSSSGDRVAVPRRSAFLYGLLAGAVGLAIMLVGRLLTGRPGFLDAITDGVLRYVPLALFDAALSSLGALAKGTLYAAIALAVPVAGGLLAIKLIRSPPRGDRLRDIVAAGVLVALVAFFLAAVLVLPLAGAGILGSDLRADAWALQAPLAVAAVTYGMVLMGFRYAAAGQADPGGMRTDQTEMPAPDMDAAPAAVDVPRRTFLARALGLVGLAALAVSGSAVFQGLARASRPLTGGGPAPADGQPMDPFGPTMALTPVDDFYQISKNLLPVSIDGQAWRLRVDGLLDGPADISLEALRAMPSQVAHRTIECISNDVPAGDDLIGNQRWRGVPIRDLLAPAGVQPAATHVLWEAADGYTESLPLEVALREDSWIVYEMGDQPLTAEHGFPARVFIAGRFGMKQPKWVTRLQLTDHDEPGYWQVRGWDREAFVVTMSRIDQPRPGETVRTDEPFMAYGIANSGDRGISRVELSPDDGATWLEAELQDATEEPLGPLTWVRWRVPVTVSGSGARRLVVRATDGSGAVQDSAFRAPLPSGSTGWHAVRIAVA